jgi:malate dehydrogenase (oxaloacetate-decarboxylating)(NADP+)
LKPITKEECLEYHSHPIAGKIEINVTKPVNDARDLSIAYSPGVAEPCLEIEKDKELAYEYTSKGNLVAVISNGTAVLGLGDIGALAGKPVMEGKGVLFKKFSYVNSFDIEVDQKNVDDIIKTVKAISPTFGGINLEDIKAPECFEIETKLQEMCDIPIFHDDQHGTAIISAAGIINGCELTNKKLEELKIVIVGAGAAGIAAGNMYKALGAKNILMTDSKGVLTTKREDLNSYKKAFASEENISTLEEALIGADVVVGNSVANCITQEMVKTLAPNAMLFAMANPNPEIKPELAKEVRDDLIIGTGRSDYPNQINNVLGFPFIFRGALDVRAKAVNMEMKIAACNALASLAKKDVPQYIKDAYGGVELSFGKEYILPKPFDRRVFVDLSVAVAKAAMESGVARKEINIDEYKESLIKMLKENENIEY